MPPAQLESPGFDTLTRLLTQPGEQAQELQQALLSVVNTPNASASAAAADVAVGVVDQVAHNMAARAGLDVDVLFPMRRFMLQTANRGALGGGNAGSFSSSGLPSTSSSSSSGETSSSIPAVTAATLSGSNGASSQGDTVLQEAAQVALAAASSGSVTKSNGKLLRMRQL